MVLNKETKPSLLDPLLYLESLYLTIQVALLGGREI